MFLEFCFTSIHLDVNNLFSFKETTELSECSCVIGKVIQTGHGLTNSFREWGHFRRTHFIIASAHAAVKFEFSRSIHSSSYIKKVTSLNRRLYFQYCSGFISPGAGLCSSAAVCCSRWVGSFLGLSISVLVGFWLDSACGGVVCRQLCGQMWRAVHPRTGL